jgi:hypothetical protein
MRRVECHGRGFLGWIKTELRGRLPGLLQAECAACLVGHVSGGVCDLRGAGVDGFPVFGHSKHGGSLVESLV